MPFTTDRDHAKRIALDASSRGCVGINVERRCVANFKDNSFYIDEGRLNDLGISLHVTPSAKHKEVK